MQKFRPTNAPKAQASTFKPLLPLEKKKLYKEDPSQTVEEAQTEGGCPGCPHRAQCRVATLGVRK